MQLPSLERIAAHLKTGLSAYFLAFLFSSATHQVQAQSCTPPETQAQLITTCVFSSSMYLNVRRGSGDKTLILAKAGSAVNGEPTNSSSYSANSTFGSGSEIGTGNFVVYNGDNDGDFSIGLSGFTPGMTYYFKSFEYNESGYCYNTVDAGNISATLSNSGQFSSLSTSQNSFPTDGINNQDIIGFSITVTGGSDPAAVVNELQFTTTGSTNPAGISSAKVFYTGNQNTFSATTQFGATVNNPNGAHTVNGSLALTTPGIHYFWIAYSLNSNSVSGNMLDATLPYVRITDDSGTTNHEPFEISPAGSRTVSSGASTPGTYCTANTRSGCGNQEISQVMLGGFSYAIACNGGYNNLTTSPAASVSPGAATTFKVVYDDWIVWAPASAWIDWNQNGTFEASERVNSGDLSSGTTYNITVPANAPIGTTRMRVYMQTDGNSNPCRNSTGGLTTDIGHILDYSVNIVSGPPPPAPCLTTAATVSPSVTIGIGADAVNLAATGTSLLWYTSPVGGTGSTTAPLPSTAATGTVAYYVSQTVGCEGPRTQIHVTTLMDCSPSVAGTAETCNSSNGIIKVTNMSIEPWNVIITDANSSVIASLEGLQGEQSFGNLIPGVYTVSMQSPTFSSNVEIEILPGSVLSSDFQLPTEGLISGGTLTFTALEVGADIEYSWNFGDGTPIVSSMNPIQTHVYLQPGNYEVTLTVSKSHCSYTGSKNITIILDVTGIELRSTKAGFRLYPNPATDLLTINVAGLQQEQIHGLSVFDAAGKMVQSLSLKGTVVTDRIQLSVNTLSTGLYTIQIITANKTYSNRVSIVQ